MKDGGRGEEDDEGGEGPAGQSIRQGNDGSIAGCFCDNHRAPASGSRVYGQCFSIKYSVWVFSPLI